LSGGENGIVETMTNTHTQTSPGYANRRTEHDFRNARRHSGLVKFLKRLLPTVSGLAVVAFVGMAAVSYSPVSDISLAGASLNDGILVMNSPKMAGFDKENRAYDVNAKRATQNLDTPNIIDLDTIDARLPVGENGYAHVDAREGTYNTESEKLKLRNQVVVKGTNGLDILLEEADIDMKSGDLVSQKPVKVLSKQRDISANAVEVEDNGKRIIFKKRVRMMIKQDGTTENVDPAPEN